MALRPYKLLEGTRILHVVPETQLRIEQEDLAKFFADGKYQRVEKEILRALYYYPFLTKRSLTRYLNAKLGQYKRDNYDNMIHAMWLDGAIERYHYADTKLYHLNKNARRYMESTIREKKKRIFIHPQPADSEAKILECTSLAQWHISLLCGNEEITRTRFYESLKQDEHTLTAYSHVEMIKNSYYYTIHSFCIPKCIEHVEEFANNLAMHIKAYSKKKSKPSNIRLFVLVAEDIEQIEQMGSVLNGRNELKGVKYHFVLDTDTNYTNGLDLLHFFSYENKEKQINTLEFVSD